MAIETTGAVGGTLIKILGVPVAAGAAATALTYMFLWPKSRREAYVRLVCTIITSVLVGPALVAAVHSWWPSLFSSAREVAALYGADPALGLLYVAAPLMVLGGLPAWWLLGGLVLWFERRRGKDVGEILQDAAKVAKDVRGAL